ncbi:hypothetical protein B7494_g7110 [Chlorociboria aeruginascens]|nr:hypothetical protein B7494_g7110 [Chlorociboria aeruginascens]
MMATPAQLAEKARQDREGAPYAPRGDNAPPLPPREDSSQAPPPYSSHDVKRSELISEQWRSHDPRSSSTHSLVPSESSRDGRRTLLLIFIHGFMGNETSFQSFPAHVHNFLALTLSDTHVVHTKIYPRYKSRKAIDFARDDFGTWLEPHESSMTDIILLGHSMGGILSAEVALRPPYSPATGRPFRHQILGTISFDTPFLGMHPGVVVSGIGSLFRPAPEPPNSRKGSGQGTITPSTGSQASASTSNNTPSASDSGIINSVSSVSDLSLNDPYFNPPFPNDVRLPERKGWSNVMHFISKHADGATLSAKFNGLSTASSQYFMSHLEFGGCLADYAGLKNRYAKLRALEDVDNLPRQNGPGYRAPTRRIRFVNYYTASTGRPKLPKIPPGQMVGEDGQLKPIEVERQDMSVAHDETHGQTATPKMSVEEYRDGTVTPPKLEDGEASQVRTQMENLGENSGIQEQPEMRHIDSMPIEDADYESLAMGGPNLSEKEPPAIELKTTASDPPLPPVPEIPTEPEPIDLSVYTDKDARKIAEKEHKRVLKTYQQAVKDRENAIKDRRKFVEKREKKIRQEQEKQLKAEQKQREKETKEEEKRQNTINPEPPKERSGPVEDDKPKRDKKFCSIVFAVFAAQPLVIVGVTGPITVFNYTVYDIITPTGANYFSFMALIGLWSLAMHWILAITNACNALKYVTRFSCDIFGFYVAFIYLQKGIQVLTRQGSGDAFYLSIVIALLVLVVGYLCGVIGTGPLFQHYIRVFIKDYGTPLTVIFFTGFVHIGKMRAVSLDTLPTSKAFFPTTERSWLIHFWDIRVSDVFIAIPFAILLTILFYFDHNVSSLIAQGTEFPLRKPAGFHWDLFLLGLTTGVAGLLGIPFPNGLIPQAPFHTDSLCVTKTITDPNEEGVNKGHVVTKIDHVVEQRFSNLAQGLLTLGTMTGPLLVVLHLIPQGVLAGLFFVMGVQALEGNGMTLKILFLLKDKSLTPASDPLRRINRRLAIWVFVAIQLIGFGATFAITQTIAAVGFPIIILLLIPFRAFVLPGWFTQEELGLLDAPTASPFTMISVGGNYGESLDAEEVDDVQGKAEEVGRSEGVFIDTQEDSDEGAAERGEGGLKRRESRGEGRSDRLGRSVEMQTPGMRRRSNIPNMDLLRSPPPIKPFKPPVPHTNLLVPCLCSPELRQALEPFLPPERSTYLLESPQSPLPATIPESSLPHLTLTYAQSLDGFISLRHNFPTAISSRATKEMSHYLRSRHDAILVGVGTAMADNPGLNTRFAEDGANIVGFEKEPRPLILDPRGRWRADEGGKLFELARRGEGRAVCWVTGEEGEGEGGKEMRKVVEEYGGYVIPAARYLPDGGLDWEFLLGKLRGRGIESLMIEGGGKVIQDLMRIRNQRLVSSVIVTVGATYFGQGGVEISPLRTGEDKEVRLRDVQWMGVSGDGVMVGRPDLGKEGKRGS